MRISVLFCALLSSILLPLSVNAKDDGEVVDSVPLFRSVAVSVDVAGAALIYLSDYGQYEAALRVNLKDKYFPVFELGYGIGKHDEDAVTGIGAEAKAPYGRIGLDFNIKKDKTDGYRVLAGFRYGYTSFDYSYTHPGVADPYYGVTTPINVSGASMSYHWLEGVFGVDAPIVGPIHMGWSVRYKRKLKSSGSEYGGAWYVPGYGTDEASHWSGTFHVAFEF